MGSPIDADDGNADVRNGGDVDSGADLAKDAASGIYIHVPFCSAICPYCDFAVQVGRETSRRLFVDTLCREIERVAPSWNRRADADSRAGRFDTIYFGGGTPSYLKTDELARILHTLRAHLPVDASARLFFEANPEDVDATCLSAWHRLGVHTLSLGVQSFDDAQLRFLGRRHTATEALRAVHEARQAGFETLSIDLMYGLPDQDPDSWRRTLEQALRLEPDHLSCYELEIHERTTFGKQVARGHLQPMPDASQADLFVTTHRWLAEHGYPGYEVSNFARRPLNQSRHNRKYWHHVPYLGLGPSAHSYAAGERWWNARHSGTWTRLLRQKDSAVEGREVLSPEDMALEAVMLGLRTRRGIDLNHLKQRYGCDLVTSNQRRLERWVESGWLHWEAQNLRATLDGWIVADRMASELDIQAF